MGRYTNLNALLSWACFLPRYAMCPTPYRPRLLAMLGLVGIVGVGGWVKKRKTRSSHESLLTRRLACRSCLSLSILLPYTSILFRTQFRLLLGFVSRAGGFKILARVKLDLVLLVLYLILQLYSASDLAWICWVGWIRYFRFQMLRFIP